ncbi:tRNA preQ1(34) S-adenosylmethionine ribosyltransferase-isomerase QueA [uncultured Nevskia sp.]|uniref:tRNA preQ1(34) S-adenosylmethionine ribosyltransferase-isomerase QueA n=1 Tax=uncultured Nevskia sp. TaxID=228950 RepID=UPI00345CC526
MQRSDFRYELPSELIAQVPPATRSGGRMLVVDPVVDAGAEATIDNFRDAYVVDLPAELRAGDLLVLNDTRVIRARLHGVKESGGRIEAMIERVLDTRRALAQIKASKTPKAGSTLLFADGGLTATVLAKHDDLYELAFETEDLLASLDAHGELPLPPYIQRTADERKSSASDDARYQTVWAREPGAVAAPTASLHFDEAMLAAIRARGVTIAFTTLHVGAGTFQPVRVDDLATHVMHAERLTVTAELAQAVADAKARGGRIVAAGTTVVRALETAAAETGIVAPYQGETRLFITPGYAFRVVDALLTNFHLPESTLLMLVCAFGGYQRVMAAYQHAVEQRYRFFSYGDAMWLPLRASQSSAP